MQKKPTMGCTIIPVWQYLNNELDRLMFVHWPNGIGISFMHTFYLHANLSH